MHAQENKRVRYRDSNRYRLLMLQSTEPLKLDRGCSNGSAGYKSARSSACEMPSHSQCVSLCLEKGLLRAPSSKQTNSCREAACSVQLTGAHNYTQNPPGCNNRTFRKIWEMTMFSHLFWFGCCCNLFPLLCKRNKGSINLKEQPLSQAVSGIIVPPIGCSPNLQLADIVNK